MTATKLCKSYLYRSGEWEEIPWVMDENREILDLYTMAFEMGNGSHDETVTLYGYPYNDNTHGRGEIHLNDSSHYSAAWKWHYSQGALYGKPYSSLDPYVAVLEIAEDACADYQEFVSPYPFAVFVHLVFTTHLVFADSFPDLVRLLNEVLPLVTPSPAREDLYRLHEWRKNRATLKSVQALEYPGEAYDELTNR